MTVRLLRHATVWIDIGGHRLLVDPMLDPPGARAPVRGTPAERPNPLVPLPVSTDEALEGVDAVLLTHTHVDHIDAAGVTALLPRGLPVFCQPPDLADLGELGLDLRAVPEQSCAAQPCHACRSQSTSSKNNVPATGFALYGAMGLKPSDL